MEGSWTISTLNSTPTGLTLDPTNVNHLWVVDAGTDRIYQYDAGTARLSGAQEPSLTYALATTNTNPQGIADPLVGPSAVAAPAVAGSNAVVGSRSEVRRDELVDRSVAEISHMAVPGMTDEPAVLACSAWLSVPAIETEEVVDQLFGDLDNLLG